MIGLVLGLGLVAAIVLTILIVAPRLADAGPADQRLAARLLVAMGLVIAAGNAWILASAGRLDIAPLAGVAVGLLLAARYGWSYRNRAS